MNDVEPTLGRLANACEKLLASLETIEDQGGLNTCLAARTPQGRRRVFEQLQETYEAIGRALADRRGGRRELGTRRNLGLHSPSNRNSS